MAKHVFADHEKAPPKIKAKANTKDLQTTVKPKSTNTEAEEFELKVDEIRKAIRQTMDYQKSINDTDPTTIKKKTSDTIKKIWRSSKWA